MSYATYFYSFKKYLFVYLAALGLSCGIQDFFSCGLQTLNCNTGDRSLTRGWIQAPCIGNTKSSHWTPREVLLLYFFFIVHHCVCVCVCVCVHSVVSNSLQPHKLQSTCLCLWDFPGKDIGGTCHFLLQRISPSQRSNLDLMQCRRFLYEVSHQGSPYICIYKIHIVCEYIYLLLIICLYVEMVFVKGQDHCCSTCHCVPVPSACGCSVCTY